MATHLRPAWEQPFPQCRRCHEPKKPRAVRIRATLASFLLGFRVLAILFQTFEEGRSPTSSGG